MEEWKEIKGYEGLYLISNHGKVKSLNFRKTGKEVIFKLSINKDGYYYTGLSKEGKRIKYLVSRLVALHFVENLNPEKFTLVCHIDSNPKNNYHTNLRWDDVKGNAKDMIEAGRGTNGEKNLNSKLTEKDVIDIRNKYSTGNYYQWELAKEYNILHQAISEVVLRKTWKHI